ASSDLVARSGGNCVPAVSPVLHPPLRVDCLAPHPDALRFGEGGGIRHMMRGLMTDLLAARLQMAVSLAFHIVFAVVGIGMPVLMILAERRWHQTGDRMFLELAHRCAKGTALLCAVGTVCRNVL